MEGLAGFEFHGRKFWFIRRVGEMLRLKTESRSPLIHRAAFAGDAAIKKISGVKLQAGFVAPDFHHSTTGRFAHARLETKLAKRA